MSGREGARRIGVPLAFVPTAKFFVFDVSRIWRTRDDIFSSAQVVLFYVSISYVIAYFSFFVSMYVSFVWGFDFVALVSVGLDFTIM